jgi:two-component system sensor histidine kinase CpxA
MQNRIYALERGDLDSEIAIIGEDELALLSKNFNKLIKEIKNLLSQKERLLADVSHEIRTPLAKMRLLSEIEKPSEKMQRLNKQIDTLDSIVTNILISDKLAAPYSNLSIEEISIHNLLLQGLELSKNKSVEILSNGSFMVWCDVVKLAIVIKNLLDNAEKYASPDCAVKITYVQEGGVTTINCQDSGPGIAESLLSQIMKPYIRGENLKKSGFGLGLSICKRVMGAHGGSIKVRNNQETGATFTIQWNSDAVGEKKDAKK